MIDVRTLRDAFDEVKVALLRKGVDPADVDRAAELDREARELASARDEFRSRRNMLSRQVGAAFKGGDTATGERLRGESKALEDDEKKAEAEAAAVEGELRDLLLRLPNVPSPAAPDGTSEADNVVVRVTGPEPGTYGAHQRVPHWDVGAQLGVLDTERATKISGSMFVMLRGLGATVSRALCQYAIDRNADAFEEIRPPSFVLPETLVATGQLPKFADEAYHIERDDLWAIPTAESPLTSIGRDEVFDHDALPMRFMAFSPCYRREAGAHGRDTRGLLRSHEFDKVEILAYCRADQGPAVHAELLERAESAMADLGLSYRVLDMCTGDLGQSHHRQFDIEVYAPGCDAWLEVSSVSWFTDYQARRANIRHRLADGSGTTVAHTLNGSALAVPRVLAAILETYRQPDGSVAIPEVLHPYCRGATTIPLPT
jgi:seryl-tRNA synthetase